MNELIDVLERCSNVEKLTYSASTGVWTVEYKDGLNPDHIQGENLIDFLENG